jgi:transposase InsO family protein
VAHLKTHANAFAERFVRSIKESCLERLILLGETSSRTAVQNFVVHYHNERNHQGLDNPVDSTRSGPPRKYG